MVFLLLQIFSLMVVAALCGAGLAWWWFRRNYQDVTYYHEDLVTKIEEAKGPAPVTKEELSSSLAAGLAGIPKTDLSGITERLGRIESALSGNTGLGALTERFTQVNDRFGEIRQSLAETRENGLGGLEARLQRIDEALMPQGVSRLDRLANRIGRVETLLQQPDDALEGVLGRLSDIESSLLSVSNEVNRLQNTDLDPVETRLEQLEDAVRNQTTPDVDLGPVHSGLARLELALENLDFPVTDLEPFRSHLTAMEARLAEFAERLDTARQNDLEELTIRMSTLSSSLSGLNMPDMDPVKARLAAIEEAIGAIEIPEQDFTPIINNLRQIEGMLRAPSDDMRVIHTKLADIEGGSASLHSKLSGVDAAVNLLARSPVDLGPLQHRLSAVESALASLRVELQSMPDYAPMERRLAALQESVLAMREPDLSPVLSSMRKLDARLDMGGLDSRLASIEYTLAALNHMLRAREFGYGRTEGDYTSRQSAFAPLRPETPGFAPIDQVIPEPAGMRTPKVTQRRADPPRPEPEPEPEPAPSPPADPIEAALRPGDKANLLTEAAFGEGDDLEIINGIGPMLCELLNDIGVYYFWQIADWGPAEVEWVDQKLEHFKGRIERDEWVAQARELARLPTSATRPGA